MATSPSSPPAPSPSVGEVEEDGPVRTSSDLLVIRIIDAGIDYELEAEDVTQVISAFAQVNDVHLPEEDKSRAFVEVMSGQGEKVASLLNGRQLLGVQGRLEVLLVSDDAQAPSVSSSGTGGPPVAASSAEVLRVDDRDNDDPPTDSLFRYLGGNPGTFNDDVSSSLEQLLSFTVSNGSLPPFPPTASCGEDLLRSGQTETAGLLHSFTNDSKLTDNGFFNSALPTAAEPQPRYTTTEGSGPLFPDPSHNDDDDASSACYHTPARLTTATKLLEFINPFQSQPQTAATTAYLPPPPPPQAYHCLQSHNLANVTPTYHRDHGPQAATTGSPYNYVYSTPFTSKLPPMHLGRQALFPRSFDDGLDRRTSAFSPNSGEDAGYNREEPSSGGGFGGRDCYRFESPSPPIGNRNVYQTQPSYAMSSPSSSRVRKWTSRYEIQIPPDNGFQVTRRVIGNRGINMKRINEATGAKLRLRGKGSGYLEGYNRQEAEDPLHLCISCCDPIKYQNARMAVGELLEGIYKEYDDWVTSKGGIPPHLNIKSNELLLQRSSGTQKVSQDMNIGAGAMDIATSTPNNSESRGVSCRNKLIVDGTRG